MTAQSEMRCAHGAMLYAHCTQCEEAGYVVHGTGRQPAADNFQPCICASGFAVNLSCPQHGTGAATTRTVAGELLTCCGKAHAYDAARAEIRAASETIARQAQEYADAREEMRVTISTQAQEIARLMAAPLVKYGQNSVQFYEAPPVDKALAECNATISARDARVRELEATLLRLRSILDPHHPTAVGWIDAALDSRQKGEL